MQIEHIYFLPGIGADSRLFGNLKLDNNIPVTYLEWKSNEKNETLEAYANRLCKQINKNVHFALIGVSLGGIVAVEMAKICKPQKLVLISSIKTKNELPPYYKIFRYIPVYKILTRNLLKRFAFIIRPFFGKMQPAEYKVFRDMLVKSDTEFIKWASHNIVNWHNIEEPQNYLHLHGNADRILPIRFIKNRVQIDGGTHYMVVKKATLLKEKINDFLQS